MRVGSSGWETGSPTVMSWLGTWLPPWLSKVTVTVYFTSPPGWRVPPSGGMVTRSPSLSVTVEPPGMVTEPSSLGVTG